MIRRSEDLSEVGKLIQALGKQTQDIVKTCLEISYFSKGSWSFDSVMTWAPAVRQMAAELISEQLKIQAKNPHMLF